MKQLFGGVALAAVLAIAAPVWAQAPANPTPADSPPAQPRPAAENAAQPSTPEKAATAAAQPQHRAARHVRGAYRTRHMRMYYAWHRPYYARHRWARGWGYRYPPRHYAWYPYRTYEEAPWGYYAPWEWPEDHVAGDLNRAELGRIFSGGGMPYGGYGPPDQPPPYAPWGY